MANANRNNYIPIFIYSTHNPYLAVSLDKQKLIYLTENDYIKCNTLGLTKYFLLNNVVYFKTYSICEIQLFNSDNQIKLPEYCEV